MTTGATGQLGLALPVQGELSGTWGDTVNNGITQYTNIAIAATLTLTNDGAVTLANTTGDASASNIVSSLTGAGTVTAQFAIVRVTGTLTTAKVVTAPSYSKTYVVVNAATGGIVTFKASGQTGVSIAVGESAWVYYNGTDYVKLVGTATAGAAGGSNTQVQYNSSGSLAGSSNLTFDGTNLTLGGGTANGVTYLNGSKVLTSGSALTFDGASLGIGTTSPIRRLTVSNSGAEGLEIGPGAANGDTAGAVTSVYYNRSSSAYVNAIENANSFIYQTSGTEGMRLTSSSLYTASGINVGIGTSSPQQKFVVSNGGAAGVEVSPSGGSQGGTYLQAYNRSGTAFVPTEIIASKIGFYTGTSPSFAALLDTSGNLGLGVTPSAWNTGYKAFVAGGTNGNNQVGGIASGSGITIVSTNYYRSSTPDEIYAGTGYAMKYLQSSGQHQWYTAASGTAGNAISFTQAMTLDASGNLGVGTTSPSSYGKFAVVGSTSQGSSFVSTGTNAFSLISAVSTGATMYLGVAGTAAGTLIDIGGISDNAAYFGSRTNTVTQLIANNTVRATISAAGGFSVGTTADPGAGAIYATGNITAYYSSDIKFKENVRDIPDALATVNAIGGKLFDWTDDYIESKGGADGYFVQKADFGVVAQDVQKVFPIAVRTREDGSLAVDYEKLGALAFAALVELTKRVEALEAK